MKRILLLVTLLFATSVYGQRPGPDSSYALGQDYRPTDQTVFSMHDDFGTGNNSAPTIGELGWSFEFIAGSGLFSAPAGTYPNLGIAHLESGPNTNDGTAFFLGRSGAGSGSLLGDLASNTNWELKFRFSLGSTTSQKTRVGLSDDPVGAVVPNNFIGVRADTTSDTNFTFECRSGGTSSIVASSVPIDTNFHTLRIWSTTAGTIKFTLDKNQVYFASPAIISSNVPTANERPAVIIGTLTTALRSIEVDYFAFTFWGLNR